MTDRDPPEQPLYRGADGIPTLFDVAVFGEDLVATNYRLPRTGPDTGVDPDTALERRLREAIESALRGAMLHAARRLPEFTERARRSDY